MPFLRAIPRAFPRLLLRPSAREIEEKSRITVCFRGKQIVEHFQGDDLTTRISVTRVEIRGFGRAADCLVYFVFRATLQLHDTEITIQIAAPAHHHLRIYA